MTTDGHLKCGVKQRNWWYLKTLQEVISICQNRLLQSWVVGMLVMHLRLSYRCSGLSADFIRIKTLLKIWKKFLIPGRYCLIEIQKADVELKVLLLFPLSLQIWQKL